ncbi:hypothetical protein [Reichenbachiella ulvae]|uniref:Uncharacterized protein n=1 Tax=Reichenbachiella ulvae TaxID=2980104 RepID=A0ABT3CND2_9BACT|nr:hypothetical protein [Reichenbachiella ulvae]MCV9385109.1 hypothetical protein [Reichenbachiella ulvae]
MKRFMHKYLSVLLAAVTLLWSCTPEEFTLEDAPMVSELNKASVTQNPADPNMVILESTNPGMTPLWTTPQGRSQRVVDTVRIPFAGEYEFYYGVLAAGGFVAVDTVQLEITTNNFDYINDPLWELLTGGVGESKTWLLDLDADGVSKYFAGPQYFYGTDNGWLEGGGPSPDGSQSIGCYGGDCWNWNPDWPGNTWIADQGDYGSMTFDLIDGAHLTANHLMIPGRGEESGVFFLDADAKTLSSTDVTPLHSPNTDACVPKWTEARVFSLTENTMQLGFLRSADCDGEAMLVFNYISKEYAENWVPEDQPDPEPPYDGNANDDLTTNVSTTKTWAMDTNYPYNWFGLDGTPLNPVVSYGDDPDGFAFDGWAPPYDADLFSATKLELSRVSDTEGTYVAMTSEGELTGSYTVDDKNNIIFDQNITFFSGLGGWFTFGTTAENALRIIKADTDAFGNVTGIWLGKRDPEKPEYLAVHFNVAAGSGGGEEPAGTEVAFDNSKLVIGDLEGNGNLRLEIYNEFGSTISDPGLNTGDLSFASSIEVTFTLSGITLNDGAAGSYDASMYYADSDWSPNGNGAVTSVTGDGTYTVTYTPGSAADGVIVFVVDMSGMATDIADLAAVSATIDKIVLY